MCKKSIHPNSNDNFNSSCAIPVGTIITEWICHRKLVSFPTLPRNNLRLNRTKSKELIFSAINREKCGQSSQPPPPCPKHWTCQLRQCLRHYTQWSTECDGSWKQLADVLQQFVVRNESPPWSRHLSNFQTTLDRRMKLGILDQLCQMSEQIEIIFGTGFLPSAT